jgi:hypothetical protein
MAQGTCALCGVAFIQTGKGRPRRYCYVCSNRETGYVQRRDCIGCGAEVARSNRVRCQDCYDKARCVDCGDPLRNLRKPRCAKCERRRQTQQACITCGANTTGRAIYCTGCRPKAAANRKRYPARDCAWCMAPFSPLRNAVHCCSATCSNALRRQLALYNAPDRSHLPICLICRQPSRKSPNAKGTYCDECGPSWKAERDRHHVTRKNHARRSVLVELVTVEQLADRDGNDCHLCGDAVDMTVSGMQPYGPTIDHVVPVSKGGRTEMSNCKLAHRHCNVTRGNRDIA